MMGKGGHVVLINGTEYAWHKIYQHTYQMNHFDFPDQVDAGTVHLCYFEWNEHVCKNIKDDKGEAIFQIEETNFSFKVLSNAEQGFNVSIEYDNFSNLGSKLINLGFDHNGYLPFSLAGRKEKFVSTGCTASNWMADNLDLLGNLMLKDLCLPGSHDSGMSQIHRPTAFSKNHNTQTQALEIIEQLNLGIRFIDIRPIIGDNIFHTGYYSKFGSDHLFSWQGARGQSLDSIVQQINRFTSEHQELIIINLSHALNTDLGNSSYRRFSQDEYNRCFLQLSGINYLYSTSSKSINLLEKKLGDLIGSKPAVLILVTDEVDLGSFHLKGFFRKEDFPIVDDYANSSNLETMINDQLDKLAKNRASSQNYFLISWILTLHGAHNITGPSIESIAHRANSSLYRLVLDFNFKSLIQKGYPNVIFQDYVNSDGISIAFAINNLIYQPLDFDQAYMMKTFY